MLQLEWNLNTKNEFQTALSLLWLGYTAPITITVYTNTRVLYPVGGGQSNARYGRTWKDKISLDTCLYIPPPPTPPLTIYDIIYLDWSCPPGCVPFYPPQELIDCMLLYYAHTKYIWMYVYIYITQEEIG